MGLHGRLMEGLASMEGDWRFPWLLYGYGAVQNINERMGVMIVLSGIHAGRYLGDVHAGFSLAVPHETGLNENRLLDRHLVGSRNVAAD